MTESVLAWVLIALAAVDWWAVALCYGLFRSDRTVVQLRNQAIRLGIEAGAATIAAGFAGAYLVGIVLPFALANVLLLVLLLSLSGPSIVFLVDVYWNRLRGKEG